MKNFQEYRPYGRAVVLGPILIPEDTSYTATLLHETGLPDGKYRILIQSAWLGQEDAHMLLSALVDGVESIQVAKHNVGGNTDPNTSFGMTEYTVTGGVMSYDLKYTFPNQGGGVQDGTLLSAEATYERMQDA